MNELIDNRLLRRLRFAVGARPARVLPRNAGKLWRLFLDMPVTLVFLPGCLLTAIISEGFVFGAGIAGFLWTIASPVFTYLIGLSSFNAPAIPEAVKLSPASRQRLVRRSTRHIRRRMLCSQMDPLVAGILLLLMSGMASLRAGSSFDWWIVIPAAVVMWLQALGTGCFLSWLYGVLKKPAALIESLVLGISRNFSCGAGFLVWMIPVTAVGLILYFTLRNGAAALAGADAILSRLLPAAGVLDWPSHSEKLPEWQILCTIGLAAFARPLVRAYLHDWREPPNVRADFLISSGAPAWGMPAVHSVLKRSNAAPTAMPEQIAASVRPPAPVEDEVTSRLTGELRKRLTGWRWDFERKPERLAGHFRFQSRVTLAGFLCLIAGLLSGNPTGATIGLMCLLFVVAKADKRFFSNLLGRGTAKPHSMLEYLPISPRSLWAAVSKAHTAELRRLLLLATVCCLVILLIETAASPLIQLRLLHGGQPLGIGRIAAGIGILFMGAAYSRRAFCARDFAMQINPSERQQSAWRFSAWGINLLCIISFWITIEATYLLGRAVALGPNDSSWKAAFVVVAACYTVTELLRGICIWFMFHQWGKPARI